MQNRKVVANANPTAQVNLISRDQSNELPVIANHRTSVLLALKLKTNGFSALGGFFEPYYRQHPTRCSIQSRSNVRRVRLCNSSGCKHHTSNMAGKCLRLLHDMPSS